MAKSDVSEKSRGVALGLAALVGVLGVHRFYVGKIGTGILMFLTGGGAAIWWIVDLVRIASGDFRDKAGRRLVDWALEPAEPRRLPSELREELDAINEDLDEVTERLEVAERRLAARKDPGGAD